MPRLKTGLEDLPSAAQRTIAATVAIGLTLGAAAVAVSLQDLSPLRIALVAAGILAGEAAWIVLPHRRSSGVRFTFGDTAVIAGMLLASPGEVVLGMGAALLAWQLFDRAEPVKLVFNVGQYAASGALGALVLQWLAPDAAALGGPAVVAILLAVALFLCANTLAVASIVAATAGDELLSVIRRMLPTNTLVTGCNGALALLLVVVSEQNAWALPALIAPIALVYLASRLGVTAQLDRERSEAALSVERRLNESSNPSRIAEVVVEGIDEILALESAVWLHGRWRTPVPEGSGRCTADPDDAQARWRRGNAFGLAIDDVPCVAVGFESGVLVAWQSGSRAAIDATDWVERLARSTRVHIARAEASTALEQERATLRAVIDGTADGIFVLDGDGRIAVWNTAMARLSGSVDEVIGTRVESVLGNGPWRQAGVHDVPRAPDHEADARVWRVAVAAVREDQEAGLLFAGVVHDVTEERRVARMKDDMLAVVSHELRTPLTPIKASAQLLSRRGDRLDPAQRTRLLNEIEGRADHMARLVEDLLLVAQLSSATGSRPRVVPATADIVEVVGEEVARLADVHAEHTLSFTGPESLIGTTDSLRLRQIVANVIDNSCKYSEPGTHVEVTLAEEGDQAVIAVRDRGRGIPPEDRERVFERFERIDDPLRMTTSGAGLGLFIVRALLNALDGHASIQSANGDGTTVTIRLPLFGVAEAAVRDDRPIQRR